MPLSMALNRYNESRGSSVTTDEGVVWLYIFWSRCSMTAVVVKSEWLLRYLTRSPAPPYRPGRRAVCLSASVSRSRLIVVRRDVFDVTVGRHIFTLTYTADVRVQVMYRGIGRDRGCGNDGEQDGFVGASMCVCVCTVLG